MKVNIWKFIHCIFELQKKQWINKWSSQFLRNLSSCKKKAWKKFRLSFRNCSSCIYNCDDHSFIQCFFRSSNIWIFIYSLSSVHLSGYITNSHNDQLPVGLIAQLVEHCTGIVEVMDSNPVQAWIFFRLNFRNCSSCIYNCDDHSFIQCFFRSSNIWIFIYSLSSVHLSGYITNSHNDQLPVGLIAQLVERCTGIVEVMGSNPVQAWIFFRLSFRNYLSCVYNCDDHSFIQCTVSWKKILEHQGQEINSVLERRRTKYKKLAKHFSSFNPFQFSLWPKTTRTVFVHWGANLL